MAHANYAGSRPKSIFLICIFTIVVVSSCACHTSYLRERALKHPTRNIGFWGVDWRGIPLSRRIAPAPAQLADKIRLENALAGFPEKPVPAEPSPEFFSAMKRILAALPDKTRKLAEDRIIGIYAVRNLGGSGYAEAVLDDKGMERYAVIVLDREVLLSRKANDWATWKENSVFKSVSGRDIRLRVIIETEEDDTVVNAIQYILLHEMGHALGMAGAVHSSWSKEALTTNEYPFARLSWKTAGMKTESLFEERFPERRSIRAYAFDKAALTLAQSGEAYRNLVRYTNYPTIHGAVNIWEDFAESFASYIHVVLENKPYEVRLYEDGQWKSVLTTCWEEARCSSKKAFMKEWFGEESEEKSRESLRRSTAMKSRDDSPEARSLRK